MDTVLVKGRQKLDSLSKSLENGRQMSVRDKDLICTVCKAPASGFNFAVITCMCCKAFFRRNALLGLQSLQCRYRTENCAINMKTRRDCSYCRLKKCFDVGMKKELILTDDLKQQKREKILRNREITSKTTDSMNRLSTQNKSLLNRIDLDCIRAIYEAFETHCRIPVTLFEKTENESLGQQPIKSRIKLQHYFRYYEKHEIALVKFCQSLPDLKDISEEEQMSLIKHNIRLLIRVSFVEVLDNQLPIWSGIDLLLETIFGKSLIDETNVLLRKLKECVNDSTCIRLSIVILLFSTYISYTGHLDTLVVYRIQEKYTKLLWLYLVQNYGESRACQRFIVLTNSCLRLVNIGHRADIRRQQIQWQNILLSLD